MRTTPEPTAADLKAEADRQFAAAKKTLAAREGKTTAAQDAHTNSVATTDAHAGLAPHDTPKPKEMETKKTDLKDVTGDPHLVRKPLDTPGKGTTDLVTAEPKGARPQGDATDFGSRAADAAAAGDPKAKPVKVKGKRGRSSKK